MSGPGNGARIDVQDAIRMTREGAETDADAARRLLEGGVEEWTPSPGEDARAYHAAVRRELQRIAGLPPPIPPAANAVSDGVAEPALLPVAVEAACCLATAAESLLYMHGELKLGYHLVDVEKRLRRAIAVEEKRQSSEALRLHGCTGALVHAEGETCEICEE